VQNPTPANADNVQRQLAIFDVVKRAPGKTLSEVKAMLTTERGLSRQPEPWLDAVAAEASYGKPYLVDLPAAVAADSITAAPDRLVEVALGERRVLRESRPVTASGNGGAASIPGTADTSWRTLLRLSGAALAAVLATAAVRAALRWRK
jgi:hypothetical protein